MNVNIDFDWHWMWSCTNQISSLLRYICLKYPIIVILQFKICCIIVDIFLWMRATLNFEIHKQKKRKWVGFKNFHLTIIQFQSAGESCCSPNSLDSWERLRAWILNAEIVEIEIESGNHYGVANNAERDPNVKMLDIMKIMMTAMIMIMMMIICWR